MSKSVVVAATATALWALGFGVDRLEVATPAKEIPDSDPVALRPEEPKEQRKKRTWYPREPYE